MTETKGIRLRVDHILYSPEREIVRLSIHLPPVSLPKKRKAVIQRVNRLGGLNDAGERVRSTPWKVEFNRQVLERDISSVDIERSTTKPFNDYDLLFVPRRNTNVELIGGTAYIASPGVCTIRGNLTDEHISIYCPPNASKRV